MYLSNATVGGLRDIYPYGIGYDLRQSAPDGRGVLVVLAPSFISKRHSLGTRHPWLGFASFSIKSGLWSVLQATRNERGMRYTGSKIIVSFRLASYLVG